MGRRWYARGLGWVLVLAVIVAGLAGIRAAPALAARSADTNASSSVFLPLYTNRSAITGSSGAVQPPANEYSLMLSLRPDRGNPVVLNGQTVQSNIYVFLSPASGISEVRFFVDDPDRAGTPVRTEAAPPWDLSGGTDAAADPFDTGSLTTGAHTLTAEMLLGNGSRTVLSAGFTVTRAPNDGNCNAPAGFDQVHLAWAAEPSTSLTVVWRTCGVDGPSTVQYRTAGATAWQQASGTLRPSGTAGTLREATLTGLSPATAYDYRVPGDNGAWSPVFLARTAPAPGPASFEAIYVADTGLVGRIDGLASGTQQVIDEIAKLKPLLLMPGGDYAYFDSDKRYGTLEASIDAWFNQMQPAAIQSVMMPAYGNHEVVLGEGYQPWANRFPTPAGFNGRRNYSFDVGDVHFISLFAPYDSQGVDPAQVAWFESDVQAARARGMRWIIPYYHVSPFADGGNHSSNLMLRDALGPLFERTGVKISLASHDQAYERSYPLVDVPARNTATSFSKTCYTMGDGVSYVKVSPGGKESNISGAFSPFRTNPAPGWTAARDNTMHHFARLVVRPGEIRVEAYGVKGDGTPPVILDTFRYTVNGCG